MPNFYEKLKDVALHGLPVASAAKKKRKKRERTPEESTVNRNQRKIFRGVEK